MLSLLIFSSFKQVLCNIHRVSKRLSLSTENKMVSTSVCTTIFMLCLREFKPTTSYTSSQSLLGEMIRRRDSKTTTINPQNPRHARFPYKIRSHWNLFQGKMYIYRIRRTCGLLSGRLKRCITRTGDNSPFVFYSTCTRNNKGSIFNSSIESRGLSTRNQKCIKTFCIHEQFLCNAKARVM